jgi:ribonuclease P protein component
MSLFSDRFSFHHETYIPTQPHQKKKNARFSSPYVDPWWPTDIETPACETSRRTVTLARLSNAADFDRVFKNCRRSADLYFTVLYRSNDLDHSRLGLAIAKKNIPLAVGRNRLKRIIRESFRNAERELKSLDIVIMARRKAGSARNEELFESLGRHWQSLDKRAKH